MNKVNDVMGRPRINTEKAKQDVDLALSGDTILSAWIKTTVDRYEEPTRKGTPKGERIGFSREKLLVAALALYDLDLRAVSRATGVKYDVIKAWRAQPSFFPKVHILGAAFAQSLLANIAAHNGVLQEAGLTLDQQMARVSWEDLRAGRVSRLLSPLEYPGLRDLHLWSRHLQASIWLVIRSAAKMPLPPAFNFVPGDLLVPPAWVTPSDVRQLRQVVVAAGHGAGASIREGIEQQILDVLSKPNAPEEERKYAAYLLVEECRRARKEGSRE